jgi:hypothetical protein
MATLQVSDIDDNFSKHLKTSMKLGNWLIRQEVITITQNNLNNSRNSASRATK